MRHMICFFVGVALLSCQKAAEPVAGVGSALQAPRLGDPVRVTTEGFFLAPRFSPDGRYLLFAGPKYQGIYVAEVGRASHIKQLSDEEYLGWPARWTEEGIETRTREGAIILFRNPTGQVERVPTGRYFDARAPSSRVHAYHENDAIHLVAQGRDVVISDGKDRYFGPLVSPDERYVVYEGLVTGLYVYDVSVGETVPVGRGNNPAWLMDSSGFLYDVTEDDGVRLTSGEIYLYLVKERRSIALTNSSDLIETHPVPSPDGRLVAFESEGTIYVAPLLGFKP